jgi:hypothetical protein
MSNLSILIGLPIGILGFLFFFWKRLKEDYGNEQIFSFSFIIAGFIIFGFVMGILFYGKLTTSIISSHGFWFWGSFLFGVIGFGIAHIKFRLRFFETLEAAGLGFLFFSLFFSLVNSVVNKDIKLLAFSIFQAILIYFFFFLDSRYKRFTWFKSGRVGFAGLVILSVFFLGRAIVALINPSMLSFTGKFDAIISSTTSFIFFLILYNLSTV